MQKDIKLSSIMKKTKVPADKDTYSGLSKTSPYFLLNRSWKLLDRLEGDEVISNGVGVSLALPVYTDKGNLPAPKRAGQVIIVCDSASGINYLAVAKEV